jgi:hypothetical protein
MQIASRIFLEVLQETRDKGLESDERKALSAERVAS